MWNGHPWGDHVHPWRKKKTQRATAVDSNYVLFQVDIRFLYSPSKPFLLVTIVRCRSLCYIPFSGVGCIIPYTCTCIVFNPDIISRVILQYQRRTETSVVVLNVEAGVIARSVYLIYNRSNSFYVY